MKLHSELQLRQMQTTLKQQLQMQAGLKQQLQKQQQQQQVQKQQLIRQRSFDGPCFRNLRLA
jgi:hypothetical protein